jgi:uncharacterized protein YigE (DUF2233 family)
MSVPRTLLEPARWAPYAHLSDLPRQLEGGAGRLLFGTNAGMFDSKLKPVGLHVEEGQELVHANT